jgi:hypothetical protein
MRANGRADGQADMRKRRVAFRNSVNAPGDLIYTNYLTPTIREGSKTIRNLNINYTILLIAVRAIREGGGE